MCPYILHLPTPFPDCVRLFPAARKPDPGRPIPEPYSPDYQSAFDRAESPAILAVAPVVPQQKVFAGIGEPLPGVLSACPAAGSQVRLWLRLTVNQYPVILQRDMLVGQPDHPLDVNALGLLRVAKSYDAPPFRSLSAALRRQGQGLHVLPVGQRGQHTSPDHHKMP